MFIRYKSDDSLFFYDRSRQLISGKNCTKVSPYSFWAKDQYIYYFNFDENSSTYYEIKDYELNKEYDVLNPKTKKKHKITFLRILQKEEECGYNYGLDDSNNGINLFESLEGPNNRLGEGDSLFREGYYKKEKDVYLSKYVTDYYPALSVSPPNFSKTGNHFWTKNSGEATKMYKAFRKDNEVPFTLFLKPHTRQWFNNGVGLTNPGTYNCTYDYDNRILTVSGEKYYDVPHTITVCCQGAGGGGGEGNLSSWAGWGGAGGGFIAANCFLGNNISAFTIQIGKGGSSGEDGQSSFVQINQTIDLTNSLTEKNPTLAYYNSSYEYTKLENTLKIEGEGGGTENKDRDVAGTGKITANTNGYYRNGDGMIESPGGEEGIRASSFLRGLFFKPLFCLKGGGGGKGGWGGSKEATNGGKAYFPTSFNNFLYSFTPSLNEDVAMTWKGDGSLLLNSIPYSCNKNKDLKASLILDGPSLQEALYFLTGIYIEHYDGGLSFEHEYNTQPSGGGGGSSIFGKGGKAGHSNDSKNGANGALGAGGGGGKAAGLVSEVGSGGKGGDGAVWLLW